MTKRLLLSAIVLCGMTATWAVADEAAIKQTLQGRFPGMTVESVKKAPFAGLYEVILDGEIVYTDEKSVTSTAGNVVKYIPLPGAGTLPRLRCKTDGRRRKRPAPLKPTAAS